MNYNRMTNHVLRRTLLSAVIFAFFFTSVALSGRAYASEAGTAPPQEWDYHLDAVFSPNRMNAGFAIGGGPGFQVLGSKKNHDLVLAFGHLGWVVTPVGGKGHWYQGSLELRAEMFGGAQVEPETKYLFGVTPIVRYNFIHGSRWVPFAEGGAGVSATDILRPDLSTIFEFNIQLGVGVQYFIRDDSSLTFQLRGFHLSNAGLDSPNRGANTVIFLIGWNRFF